MAFHKSPVDKPRLRKKFLTARNVEDMAAAGAKEIIHSPDLVITDAARETAIDLNIKIINPALLKNRIQDIPESKSNVNAAGSNESSPSPHQNLKETNTNTLTNIRETGSEKKQIPTAVKLKDEAILRELVDLIEENWKPKFKSNRQLKK